MVVPLEEAFGMVNPILSKKDTCLNRVLRTPVHETKLAVVSTAVEGRGAFRAPSAENSLALGNRSRSRAETVIGRKAMGTPTERTLEEIRRRMDVFLEKELTAPVRLLERESGALHL